MAKTYSAAEGGELRSKVEAAGVPWAKFLQALPILLRLWQSADVKELIAIFTTAAVEPVTPSNPTV